MEGVTFAEAFLAILAACGLPSAITAMLMRRMEKRMDARERQHEEKEKARAQFEFIMIQNTSAAITLGEATARAVQRIPDAHCNGDMTAALEKVKKMKDERKDFLAKQGIEHLYED